MKLLASLYVGKPQNILDVISLFKYRGEVLSLSFSTGNNYRDGYSLTKRGFALSRLYLR